MESLSCSENLPADRKKSAEEADGSSESDSEDIIVKIIRSYIDDLNSEDSSESCYKRRKISKTWTIVSPTIIDGHAWRKYGKKEILNAKYPRNYFRCTHKFDQGCRATKQVQITEDEPTMYRTTYHGDHTCH